MTDNRESALRQCIEAYVDPWLGHSLGEVRAVRAARVSGDQAKVDICLGFPAADYAAELREALAQHASTLRWLRGIEVTVS